MSFTHAAARKSDDAMQAFLARGTLLELRVVARESEARPVNRWRTKDADRAYVIGYTGICDNPEGRDYMAPSHYRYAAAVFEQPDPSDGYLLWWYAEGLGAIHGVSDVCCGARLTRKEAERDARDWAELCRHEAEEWDVAGVGTFKQFDSIHHEGFVLATLRVAPDRIGDPGFRLWNFKTDSPQPKAVELTGEWRWN